MVSILPWILSAPLFGIALLLCFRQLSRNQQTWIALAAPAFGLLLLAPLIPQLLQGEVLQQQWQWLPLLGLQWTLRLDALALLFVLLIFGIGLLVIFYARYYLSPKDPMGRFYACLLLFMQAMLGIVLSGNVLQLWLFWELTSICSFLLISYWSHRSDARKGARLALTVTAAGGLALLVGLVLLGQVAGSYQLDVILSKGAEIVAHAQYPLILTLVLLGAFTKSA
jgi:multicomponent K+:H+ antiporter subunit A